MTGQTVRLVGPSQIQLAHRLIDKAPPGAVFNIREATRSLDQNAKFHAMVSDISRARPEGRVLPTDIWKVLIIAAATGAKVRFEPSLDGDGVIPVGLKSSNLTVKAMSDCIEWMYAKGATDWNIHWSEPVDNPSR